MQLLGFWNFFDFFQFFPSKLVYFWTKSRKKRYGCFFHSVCATDLNFGTKNIERTKLSTLKTLIFANFWGPEVVGSSLYQKNIGAKFTHLYIPSLCKEFFVMRHNLGHPKLLVSLPWKLGNQYCHIIVYTCLGLYVDKRYLKRENASA